MPKIKKNTVEASILLNFLFLKSASTKISLKNLIREETAPALKDGQELCLFVFLSSDPLLQHHPLSPLFSSHRCCYSECMMPAYSRETSELSSSKHETRSFASHTASYLHSPSFHIQKKTGLSDGEAGCLLQQTENKKEGNVGCSFLFKVCNVPSPALFLCCCVPPPHSSLSKHCGLHLFLFVPLSLCL